MAKGAGHFVIALTNALPLSLAISLDVRPRAPGTLLRTLLSLKSRVTAHDAARLSPQALEARRQNRLGRLLAGTCSFEGASYSSAAFRVGM